MRTHTPASMHAHTNTYTQKQVAKRSSVSLCFVPLSQTTWYRKHFNLPSDWKNASVRVYFQGVFRGAAIFLNGEMLTYHDSGYTSFSVDLSPGKGALFGEGKTNENVIAIRSQSFGGTGHWYEGGGLYRHNFLIKSDPVRFTPDGILAAFVFPEESSGNNVHFHETNNHRKGQFASEATLQVRASVYNGEEGKTKGESVSCVFSLFDEDNKKVGEVTSDSLWIKSKETGELMAEMTVENVELWSPARTYVYHVTATLSTKTKETDEVENIPVGARMTYWSPNDGFQLNGGAFKWRGFNDHNDFTGVGVAVPERINLFRSQSIRAVGGNARRMSHNPPVPTLLDILDHVGVLVWNENRNFGSYEAWSNDMADLVRRDRNHPSVMIWSFCNEGGCNVSDNAGAGGTFRAASKALDPYRPVSANMIARRDSDFGNDLGFEIDVQGFSHMQSYIFDDFHATFPQQPIINSECCSCVTQRGEDVPDPKAATLGNFNADCISEQTSRGLARKFVAGSMVWTLFDYYGEPTPYRWPMVSCSFGSIDLAGFSKAAAFWYRSWWLYNTTNASNSPLDVPYPAPSLLDPEKLADEQVAKDTDGFLVHIVQHWEENVGGSPRTINVYSNAPMVELLINEKSQGKQQLSWLGWASFNVSFEAGTLTANAVTNDGHVLATHTVATAGAAVKIVTTLDVPNEQTGTGTALVADGQDAGLVRAMVVDAKGNIVPSSSHNITFEIVSGPGRIIGVGNGNPSCHEPNLVSWRSAYHGLSRAVVQTTATTALLPQERRRILEIDAEAGLRTTITSPEDALSVEAESIVVKASSPGLESSTVSIPVSNDLSKHSVLAVAKAWAKSGRD